jgi:hypothetical protein
MIVKMAGGWLEEEQERMTGRGGVMIVRRILAVVEKREHGRAQTVDDARHGAWFA